MVIAIAFLLLLLLLMMMTSCKTSDLSLPRDHYTDRDLIQ